MPVSGVVVSQGEGSFVVVMESPCCSSCLIAYWEPVYTAKLFDADKAASFINPYCDPAGLEASDENGFTAAIKHSKHSACWGARCFLQADPLVAVEVPVNSTRELQCAV